MFMILNFFNFNFDIARTGQISFQDPATPIMEGIIDLHHNIFYYLIILKSKILLFH